MKPNDVTLTPYGRAVQALRGAFIRAGFFSAAINLLMLTGPLYMLQIYDRVLASGSVSTLTGLFLIVLVLYAFMGVYEFIRSRVLSRAAFRFDEMTGELAFLQVLENGGQRSKSASSLRDLEVVRSFLSGPAIRGLFDLPWIPIFLVAVFIIHPWLGYLTLAGAAVVVVLAVINQWTSRKPLAQAMQLDGAERAFVNQSLRSTEAIKALGMRAAVTKRWRAAHEGAVAQSQMGGDRSDGFSASARVFRLLLQSMLLTAGAYLALQQQISAGMIVGASILAGRALAPIDQVIGQWRGIGRASEAHKRLSEVFDEAPAHKPKVALPKPTGAIRLKNVTKLVPANGQRVRARILDQVSFALEPGDVLGIIGNSAAGKSSLAKTLVGVWRPDFGEVRLDGATLDQWDPDDLGQHIGYLPQHVEMLPGTIAENISRFDDQAKEKDIFEAARHAGVHEMILGFPDGYATRVGHEGQPLSGGQAQRIGLARAMFKLPRLVVLDEPDAHLDSYGDQTVIEAISLLREAGSTVVVTAHRPNVLLQSNKVLILNKGKVAKFGPRDEIVNMAMQSVPSEPIPFESRRAG
ncbi:type I secretion system permease/ATPase [Ruegeria lacuscaerulensis]|uniref:type I secretion system permease/ATPase n=1 Tax=Ruegeria lacuscaerulensis TaxID=55218 RepID=UPI00147E3FD3|nr:type I secretion system permease/ATPase [Ruegeria lacuscaerulensis]